MEICGNDIFTSQDIGALQKTLENIHYGEKYSQFISGDTNYQDPSIRFRPGYAWILLNDPVLKEQYTKGTAAYWPFFELDFYIFTSLIYLIVGEV
jgi:hypothetical protein